MFYAIVKLVYITQLLLLAITFYFKALIICIKTLQVYFKELINAKYKNTKRLSLRTTSFYHLISIRYYRLMDGGNCEVPQSALG